MTRHGTTVIGGWLLALFTGVVCGGAGAALSLPAGELMVRVHHVSNFEGGAGYLVAFLLLPLGFLVGAVTGVTLMRVASPRGAVAVFRRQGYAILVSAGLLTVGYAVAYLLGQV